MPVAAHITECMVPNGFVLVPDRQPGYVRVPMVWQGRPLYWSLPISLELRHSSAFKIEFDINNRISSSFMGV